MAIDNPGGGGSGGTVTTTTAGAPGAAVPAAADYVGLRIAPGLAGAGNLVGAQGDAAGNLMVVGNVAAGAADAGNPVKIGGVYSTGVLTLTNGQRSNVMLDVNGNLRAAITGPVVAAGNGINPSRALVLQSNTSAGGFPLGVSGYTYNGTTQDPIRGITGVDGTGIGVQAVEQAGASWANITTAANTPVKAGATTLHKIVINTPAALATITIYNDTTGTTNRLGTITMPATLATSGPQEIIYDAYLSTGLTIVTTGTQDITVVYR